MLMTDFISIIRNNNPCKEGLRWLSKASKGHKTTTTFFRSLKNTEYNQWCYSQHGYIKWIFFICLDWTEVCGQEHACWSHNGYSKFMKKTFGVKYSFDVPVPDLCEALMRAFK